MAIEFPSNPWASGFNVTPQTIRESLIVHLLARRTPAADVAQLLDFSEVSSLRRFVDRAVEL